MIKTLEFKGHEFKIEYAETYATHPTWYSFEDEKDVREAFWNIKPGDVVLDVGACCGSYTFTALAMGALWVDAWAPGFLQEGTKEVDILESNLQLNGWNGSSIHRGEVYDWGLYDKIGFLDPHVQKFSEFPGDRTIPVVDLDWWSRSPDGLKGADWIKLDVEGAECEVLRGGINFIRQHRPNILVENHLFVRPTIAQEVYGIIMSVEGYRLKGSMPHAASNVVHDFYSCEK